MLAVILLLTKKIKMHLYFWSIMVGGIGLFTIVAGLLHYHQALAFRAALVPADPQVVTATIDLMAKSSIWSLCLGLVSLVFSSVCFYTARKRKDTHHAA